MAKRTSNYHEYNGYFYTVAIDTSNDRVYWTVYVKQDSGLWWRRGYYRVTGSYTDWLSFAPTNDYAKISRAHADATKHIDELLDQARRDEKAVEYLNDTRLATLGVLEEHGS